MLSEDEIKSVYSLPLHVVKGSLIDFETTGVPRQDPACEVVALGYLRGDELTVMQRRVREKAPFYAEVRRVLEVLPRPFYSFNAGFERDVMLLELGMPLPEADFVDLMLPWKAKAGDAGLKWPSLDELVSEPEDYFRTGKVSGKQVPRLWASYLSHPEDEGALKAIMQHCFSDILREATLLLRYPYYVGASGPDLARAL